MTPRALAIVHSVQCLAAETGGPARTVTALCRALEAEGVRAPLVAQQCGGEADIALPPRTTFAGRRGLLGVRAFARALRRTIDDAPADLVHDHGIWLPTNRVAAREARRAKRPRV